MSNATPSVSSSDASFLAAFACPSASNAVNHGAVTRRQMEVQERVAGSVARKSTQGVRSTQAATAARFASLRAIRPGSPPTLSAHRNPSNASSTQSMLGVLMVSPLNTPAASLPPLVRRNTFGSGQAGL